MKRFFLAFLIGFICVKAEAQSWPSKPLRYIVPYPPGAFNDTLARTLAAELPRTLGQPVVVENRPGGNTLIGTEAAAKSPADGYTLFGAALPFSVVQSLYKTSFDVTKDFAPIVLAGITPNLLVANPSMPFDNVKDLIAYAKANPGKLTFGSSGSGAASHLSAELFKSLAGVDMLHVPYKGTGQAVTDLLAGQIDLMFAPAQTVMQHVQAGRLKALAVTSARRSATMPELPAAAEALPGYEAIGWFGLLAPAATPRAVVAKISADANRVLADPEVKQKTVALGAETSGNTPEQFAKFIRDDQAKWSGIMRAKGIAPE